MCQMLGKHVEQERQNSKKGFEMNGHACSGERSFRGFGLDLLSVFKDGRPDSENSKLV